MYADVVSGRRVYLQPFGTGLTTAHLSTALDRRWSQLGRMLRHYDRAEFQRILALVEAFVSLESGELEPDDAWRVRLASIDIPKGQA